MRLAVIVFAVLLVAAPATAQERLAAGAAVQRSLAAGEKHSYELQLRTGEFALIVIGQPDWDHFFRVAADVVAPDGSRTRTALPGLLRFPLWLIAPATGPYRIEIELASNRVERGVYTLRVAEVRTATDADRTRVAAARTLAEANRLNQERSTDSKQPAAELYRDALSQFRSIGDRAGEAYVLMTLAPRFFSGGTKNSADYLKEARSLWQALGEREMEATTLVMAATFLDFVLSKPDEAIALLQEALPIWQTVGNREREAWVLGLMGTAYGDLYEFQAAIDYGNQAVAALRAIGSVREEVALVMLAMLCERWGDRERTIEYYSQAAESARRAGNRLRQASQLINVSAAYAAAGDFQSASERALQALEIYRAAGQRGAEIMAIGHLGSNAVQRGEPYRALEYFSEALTYHRSVSKDKGQQAIVLSEMATAYSRLADRGKAIECVLEALSLWPGVPETRFGLLDQAAFLYWDAGDRQKAREYWKQMLEESGAAGDIHSAATARFGLARSERAEGRLEQARRYVEEALAALESYRGRLPGPEARANYSVTLRGRYEFYIDLLMEMYAAQPDQGFGAQAFEAGEKARSRSLLEMVSEKHGEFRQGVDGKLLDKQRALQHRLNLAAGRQLQLRNRKHTDAEKTAIAREIAELNAAYGLVEAQVRAASPRYAGFAQPSSLRVAELQSQVLDANAALLEYALGDARSFLWAVTADLLAAFELPPRAEIEDAARRVYQLLASRKAPASPTYRDAASRLSRVLLGPVAGLLESKRLIIVSDGALQFLPFAALPDPAAPAQPLIVGHEIVHLPSASVMAAVRQQLKDRNAAPKSAAVLADPVFESDDPRVQRREAGGRARQAASIERALGDVGLKRIPRLLFSRREADAIAAAAGGNKLLVATGFDATRETATGSALRQYRIVHFATHGLLNSQTPALSGLVFSMLDRNGRPQNGFLGLDDIYGLELSADLVVLSACQTALGKDIKGEGLVGVTRGFMYAGAPRVVASLWNVNDAATADLMARFYRAMLAGRQRPAAALRAAQLELLRTKRWHDPYYWAAFQFQGEWK